MRGSRIVAAVTPVLMLLALLCAPAATRQSTRPLSAATVTQTEHPSAVTVPATASSAAAMTSGDCADDAPAVAPGAASHLVPPTGSPAVTTGAAPANMTVPAAPHTRAVPPPMGLVLADLATLRH